MIWFESILSNLLNPQNCLSLETLGHCYSYHRAASISSQLSLTSNKTKLTLAPEARWSRWQMAEPEKRLEGLNTDACAIEINGLGEECWATAYFSPTALLFTFFKPSERSCLWLTGKFPYRSEHKLALHLSDVQTSVRECTESCGAGWEMDSIIFSTEVYEDLESLCVCVCWESRGYRDWWS